MFDTETVRVYQAYAPEIARPATAAGRFVPPFSRTRMTWIKPSFLWMAYRCGWATKPGQERVLAVDVSRGGFEWALRHSALSHFDRAGYPDAPSWRAAVKANPVRVQWDPERDVRLRPLPHRAIQIGIGGAAVARYVDEWTVRITDVTDLMTEVGRLASIGAVDEAVRLAPAERPYPLPEDMPAHVLPAG
ncbi:DUF4291 domain-containing protein [Stackebrandtia albiflava]